MLSFAATISCCIRTRSLIGAMMRYLCVHGHFYQPPRENPFLEAIELQDSAYPYHDWNERVASECYAPNATSRILDGEQRIIQLVNNYSRISFNFGPTLLSWIEQKADPRIIVHQLDDALLAIEDSRCCIGRVALRGHSFVPVVI